MRHWKACFTAFAILGTAATAVAEDLKMATIAPGSSAYLTMSTMATIVNRGQDEHDITVDATGAATRHMISLAEGDLDFAMTSPTIYRFLSEGTRMYQQLERAPELAEELRLVFWFPYGAYHVLTYADSGIASLEDLRGKTVFLGPPGGGAWATAQKWVEAQTGMKPDEDFESFNGSWSSAFQAFQDRQIDVYINGGIAPFPQVEQLTATAQLTLLGPTKAEVETMDEAKLAPARVPGRKLDPIPVAVYGEGVTNSEDVYTINSIVGVATRASLDEETVYRVTKAFWEGTAAMRDSAPWLEDITLDYAVQDGGLGLHPGAERYYREIGVTIPEGSAAPAQ
ncbi:TAXI family TRAP transporter solute-binding subunit [Algihabitans albus]|uniref:TAXI family TRAP transporter solute-binding subunit n=1 Tax=Algihabitans albus TaxID=2164067 RepID=UPI000E5D1A93|nr:TAXI family TRAP transporter solute-binding subunit [Algihabitans albus]